MTLNEKELIVEAIMALKGYNARLSNMEEQQDELAYRVDSLESQINWLDSSIYDIKEKSEN